MELGSTYDDMMGVKNLAQQRNAAQIAMIQQDIQKIDSVLATGKESELKTLHIELDGTYQDLIRNWGSSTYNYIQGHGYTYRHMGVSSLRHNLTAIRGRLRGYLLQLSPEVGDVLLTDSSSAKVGGCADNAEAGPLGNPSARSNMYDTIKGRKFDVAKEYARIWKLFNTADHVGPRSTPLRLLVDGNLQFFPDSFKCRALTLADFNDTYGFNFNAPNELVTVDELISYCEYVTTLCDYLWEYGADSLDDDSEYLRDDLFKTVESCMDEIGLVSAKRNNITIYVDKDPTVTTVSEIVDEPLSYDVKSYIHNQTRGDLQKKKAILKSLADDVEPKRNALNGINKTLSGNLFQMLQKFVRHNNEDNAYIKSLSSAELESSYDDIYQMWLLATLELDNIERSQRVKKILGAINSPAT